MKYKKYEIIEMCENAFTEVNTFYKKDFINYRGKTSDTNEYYTEIVAQYVLEHLEEYKNGIIVITRNKSYKTDGHNGEFSPCSNRIEEIIAKEMYRQGITFDSIGKIIDYQTPLKSKKDDVAGKFDLLSYNEKNNTVYILELKKPDSDETMLRCVLEGYTYLQTINKEKLLCDFNIPPMTKVVASPLVFRNGKQENEMIEGRHLLNRLMQNLGIKPYYITKENEIYFVEE